MLRSKFYHSLLSLPLGLVLSAGLTGAQQARQVQVGALQDHVGAVYVATNDATANEVLVFNRFEDGRLELSPQVFPTGGRGTGAGLGNQGGVILSKDDRLLFVVNAGSDDFSVFRVLEDGLVLLEVVASSGRNPISLAQQGSHLFLLNAGGSVGGIDNVEAFRIQLGGPLQRIIGSLQSLSAAITEPAQVGCTPDGSVVVVTEKLTNMITTYLVDSDGLLGPPNPQASVGKIPFGFAFGKRNQLFVTEAFSQLVVLGATARGGITKNPKTPQSSSVTSYELHSDGILNVIDPEVLTLQDATCWAALSAGANFLYTTNTGSDTITGFNVSFDGELSLLNSNGVTAPTPDAPIDMDFSSDGQFLYVLTTGCGSITGFEMSCPEDGQLTMLLSLLGPAGLPSPTNGLAAR